MRRAYTRLGLIVAGHCTSYINLCGSILIVMYHDAWLFEKAHLA